MSIVPLIPWAVLMSMPKCWVPILEGDKLKRLPNRFSPYSSNPLEIPWRSVPNRAGSRTPW